MKLLFFISSLRSGGAERVVSRLANFWAERGHDIAIVTLWDKSDDFYTLHPAVKRFTIDAHGARKNFIAALHRDFFAISSLRAMVQKEKPDAVLSFNGKNNLLAVLATLFLPVRLIISERSNRAAARLSIITRTAQRVLYPFADKLVSVSRGADKDFDWMAPYKRAVIYNPLPQGEDDAARTDNIVLPEGPKFLTVGRLSYPKNHAILIEAFSRLAPDFPAWNLVIAGEGPLRTDLERQIETLGVANRVRLLGNIKNVPDVMAACDVFVLSSRYEGFPNVLIEAMTCDMAAISFDCPHGPSEIIEDGRNGLLVPAEDAAKLETAMRDLAANDEQRRVLGQNAKEITKTLDIAVIAEQWRSVIGTTA